MRKVFASRLRTYYIPHQRYRGKTAILIFVCFKLVFPFFTVPIILHSYMMIIVFDADQYHISVLIVCTERLCTTQTIFRYFTPLIVATFFYNCLP